MKKKVLFIIGTRPEAIKIAPLIIQFKESEKFETFVCVTAQHREMLDQVLTLFDIEPDFDLDLMNKNQTLSNILSKSLIEITKILKDLKPDLCIVHGDTSTTLSGSIASFYEGIDVAHIEAGLRTGNIFSPWPEEANRKITGILTKYHFCPTNNSKNNLLAEGVNSNSIFVTGNTVIDSLLYIKNKIDSDINIANKLKKEFSFLDSKKKMLLVTGHRRESFGDGFERICKAILRVAKEFHDFVQIVYPVHLNPNVKEPVEKYLSNVDNIFLIKPQEYLQFIYLMDSSYIILTDSGGIQEEAPSLGKPVLVMRDNTERPEAIEAGTVKLVGTDEDLIFSNVKSLIQDKDFYNKISFSHNPYGDGKSTKRIINELEKII